MIAPLSFDLLRCWGVGRGEKDHTEGREIVEWGKDTTRRKAEERTVPMAVLPFLPEGLQIKTEEEWTEMVMSA